MVGTLTIGAVITAFVSEISDLDTGVHKGWART